MAEDDRDFEVISHTRRYQLVAGDDWNGVWDLEADGPDAIERFPATDEGLEQAEARFAELRRRDRHERWSGVRIAAWVVAVSTIVWVLTDTAAAILILPIELSDDVFSWAFTISHIAWHVTIGGLVILLVLTVVRLAPLLVERFGAGSARPQEHAGFPASGTAVGFLLWAGGLAVAVWILSALVAQLLPLESVEIPFGDMGLGGFVETRPTRAALILQQISIIAFRVWVAAFVVYVVGWLRAFLPARTEPAA